MKTPDRGDSLTGHGSDNPGPASISGREVGALETAREDPPSGPGSLPRPGAYRPKRLGPSPIVAALRLLRLSRGWTMQRMADEMGANKSDISMWEAGVHIPRFDRLERWADVFEQRLAMLPREPS